MSLDSRQLEQLQPFCSVSSSAVQSEDEEAWLKARTRGVGGSDVGAICGVNHWSSALQIYFNKTGQFQDERQPDEASLERMHFGHVLEPVVADEFEHRNEGVTCIEPDCSFSSTTYNFLLANVDRFVLNDDGDIIGILECKTASSIMDSEWESGDIPLSYYYQVQHYMYVTGIHRAWICALVGGNKFYQYDLYYDAELYEGTILPQLDHFWNNCVCKLREPEVQAADSDMFSELFPADAAAQEPVNLEDPVLNDLGAEYLELKRQAKDIDKRLKEIQAEYKNALRDNVKGYTRDYEITWSPRTRTSVDSTLLRTNYPDIYEACCKTTSYRQMGVKAVNNEDLSF